MNKVQNIFLVLILCCVSVNAQTKVFKPTKQDVKTVSEFDGKKEFDDSLTRKTKPNKHRSCLGCICCRSVHSWPKQLVI